MLAEVLCTVLAVRKGREMLEIRGRSDGEVVDPEAPRPVPTAVAMAGGFVDCGAFDGEDNSVGIGAAVA